MPSPGLITAGLPSGAPKARAGCTGAAVLPLLDPKESVKELRWAKEHGACGFFKRGFDLDRKVSDPHFFPVYEEADALDLPVCIHTGHPLPGHEWDRGFPVMAAFTAVVTSKLPERFPNLRFGFIEAGASWIPYTIAQLETQQRSHRLHERSTSLDLTRDLFRENRLFVALDPVDDIEYLLSFGTEDNPGHRHRLLPLGPVGEPGPRWVKSRNGPKKAR